jgi:hypothetical protein
LSENASFGRISREEASEQKDKIMNNVNITLTGVGVQDTQELDIQVSIVATINIEAKAAKRQVTSWLVSEVGNMLIGGMPQLIINRAETIWRVPVILHSSSIGPIGEVGTVDVNAESGELIISHELREQLIKNAKHLVRPTPSPVS